MEKSAQGIDAQAIASLGRGGQELGLESELSEFKSWLLHLSFGRVQENDLFESWFLSCVNGDDNSSYLVALLWGKMRSDKEDLT